MPNTSTSGKKYSRLERMTELANASRGLTLSELVEVVLYLRERGLRTEDIKDAPLRDLLRKLGPENA